MSSTKIITSILTGVAIGILIAPDRGSATRKKISRCVNDLSNYLQDMINDARDTVNEWADEGIESVTNMENQFEGL